MNQDPSATTPLRRTPLYDRHVALGAKLVDFGGWEMPIEYAASLSAGGHSRGGGVVAEHTAVREGVGVFDVSHMGKLRVHGVGALAALNGVVTNDLTRVGPGQAQYSMLCNDAGGVIDDLIVYVVADDELMLVPNATNAGRVAAVLRASLPAPVAVVDRHDDLGIIAVQGPKSPETLDAVGLPTDQEYMSFASVKRNGLPIAVCRTGYTGEHGYELMVVAEQLGEVWDAVLAAGEAYAVSPVGLGARDTLRTEMGYPLHGQDLSESISPVEARLGWAVGWSKTAFHGRDSLRAAREQGPTRVLRGLLATGRGVPRPHMAVMRGTQSVGETTSGTFSPTLKHGIALALLDPSVADGDALTIDVRGRPLDVRVVKPPFVSSSAR